MATVDWPDIKEPGKISIRVLKGRYKSDFEEGKIQVAKQYTRPKKRFNLQWGHEEAYHTLYREDKEILEEFFSKNSGNIINWTNHQDEEIHQVIFIDEKIKFSQIKPGYFSCSLSLEEL